jgi:uncharacterized double-CXXCG motif protein
MMRFYELVTGDIELRKGRYNAGYKWGLPGVTCPHCRATWAGAGQNYPAVDLSGHQDAKKLRKAYLEEDFAEYERLRDQVRALVPPDYPLEPGTTFGPLVGKARGPFSAFVHHYADTLLVQPAVLEVLHAERLRGLRGCRTEMLFRPKGTPELLDLHIEPRGLLHRDCIPRSTPPPCPKCGRHGFILPKERILDVASIPRDLDLFRLLSSSMVLVVTERFKDTVERLELDGLTFRELPIR